MKEGKADGLVSSGSTGAVLTAGVLILGRLKGVSRPALCPIIPNHTGGGTFLCDCGANLECKPINLVHFALMGSAYAQTVYGIEKPTVGLLNNGTEDHKGLLLQQETNALLKKVETINYVGNREGRDIMFGDVDVMVADGFTGNIAMKSAVLWEKILFPSLLTPHHLNLAEGCGKAVSAIMKKAFKRNLFSKLRALLCGDIIKNIKKGLDYEGVGGAMFLGLTKAVVKGHGNSKARSFAVSIEQAANAVRGNMTAKIKELIDGVDLASIQAQAQEAAAGQAE